MMMMIIIIFIIVKLIFWEHPTSCDAFACQKSYAFITLNIILGFNEPNILIFQK